jgi:hypothetical protein
MPTQIERTSSLKAGNTAVATAIAGSQTIYLSHASAFAFVVPAGVSATIAWHASATDDGPYFPVYLSSGAAAQTTVVGGRVYVAPPELFACPYVRGVAGTAFNIQVMTKS